MVKKLSCVSCGSLKRFPHTFTTVGGFGMENSNFGLQRTNPFAPFDDYPGLQQKSQCS